MRRLVKSALFGVLATLVVVLLTAGTAAAARTAPSGTFTVKAGQTMHFTNMNISAGTQLDAYYVISTTTYFLGSNAGQEGTNVVLPDWSYTNTSGSTETVRLVTHDAWGSYYSDHTSFSAVPGSGSVDYAALGYVKGKVVVSINDSNGGTAVEGSVPTLGQGNFNATLTIGKR